MLAILPRQLLNLMAPAPRLLLVVAVLSACWRLSAAAASASDSVPAIQPSAGTHAAAAEHHGEGPGGLREMIAAALSSGEKTIVVPPGRYRVEPENREHLRFEGVEDVTIVMEGVEMVCTETTRAITIDKCRNLTLRGLTIDYDPLPFTQGRIVEIADDTGSFIVEIIGGYPEPGDVRGSVEIFDAQTGKLKSRITHYSAQCEMDGPMRAVVTKNRTSPEFAIEQVGDIAVIRVNHAPGGSQPHAIMATDSRDLLFEDITLFSGPTFGILENGCDSSRYLRCRIEPRPPESEVVAREMPRLRSMNADAFHSKNARHGPSYEGCVAYHMGDDAIAINGDFHFISEADGPELRVLAKGRMRMKEGDTVQFLTFEGERPTDRRIVSILPDGQITVEEREDLVGRNLNDNLKRNELSDAYRLVLDAEAEGVGRGTLICDADGIGSGFSIRNCRLGWNRSRGILVKAGRGEITGNEITGAVMTGILVSPEYWWLEAGMAENLLIADNVITEGGGKGIVVVAEGGDGTVAPAGAFRNITVRGNTIRGGAEPAILITSVAGLVEVDNFAEPDPAKALHPWEVKSWGREGVETVMKINIADGGMPGPL